MNGTFIKQIKTICHDELVRELNEQRPQFILFIPVLMALGIGAYFSLRAEPDVIWAPLAVLSGAAGVFFLRHVARLRLVLWALLLVALGFAAAQIRSHHVYTPMLAKEMKFADIEGRVESIEVLEKGVRVVLWDVVIEDMREEDTPRKIRVKLWKGDDLRVGQRISGLAGLNPPSAPVIPRGFDFQRHMYFKGIGAVGFVYKPPVILEEAGGGVGTGVVQSLRHKIGQRVRGGLDGSSAGLASALMIGQKTAINKDDLEAIRVAGLAHMLAISGLHIGLFSGVVFFACRILMALRPSFALRHPIKKYAAVIAIFGAFFYMMIAGASIPAQRAMITVLVFFAAVLLDRSAISLRVVAFAAFMLLLFFPESLMSVSFQMSFAAVAGLVAFYDFLRPYWTQWYGQAGFLRRAGLYLLGVSFTTVVATIATGPFALFHFQHLPSYGLLANLLCVPILGFWIMPGVIGALVLMPFGLEGLALSFIEPALQAMLWISHFVEDMKGSALHVPQWGLHTLLLSVFAGLSFVLLRGRLRVILGVNLIVLVVLTLQSKQPDVLISSKYGLVAFRSNAPYLHVSSRKGERFARENWERALGLEKGGAKSFPREGMFESDGFKAFCGEMGCRFEMKGRKIAYLRREDVSDVREDCDWADIVLSKQPVRETCGADHALNKFDVYRHGAHAIYLDGDIRIERSEDFRGKRLWNDEKHENRYKPRKY